jgi:hypothetical protein
MELHVHVKRLSASTVSELGKIAHTPLSPADPTAKQIKLLAQAVLDLEEHCKSLEGALQQVAEALAKKR